MMKRNAHIPQGGDAALAQRLSNFLRQQHPIKTAHHVSAEVSIPRATVQKWLEGAAFPGGTTLLVLIDHYGAQLLAALFEPSPLWVIQAIAGDRVAEIESEIERLNAKLVVLRAGLRQ